MPIYEYECDGCGHRMEVIQKVSDEALTECPSCHEHQLRKLVSAAAFQLKGSGWYVTDFRDKPKTSGGGAEKSAESTDSKTDNTKTAGAEPEKKSGESAKTGTSKVAASSD